VFEIDHKEDKNVVDKVFRNPMIDQSQMREGTKRSKRGKVQKKEHVNNQLVHLI